MMGQSCAKQLASGAKKSNDERSERRIYADKNYLSISFNSSGMGISDDFSSWTRGITPRPWSIWLLEAPGAGRSTMEIAGDGSFVAYEITTGWINIQPAMTGWLSSGEPPRWLTDSHMIEGVLSGSFCLICGYKTLWTPMKLSWNAKFYRLWNIIFMHLRKVYMFSPLLPDKTMSHIILVKSYLPICSPFFPNEWWFLLTKPGTSFTSKDIRGG